MSDIIFNPFHAVMTMILSFFDNPSDIVIVMAFFASAGMVIMVIAGVAGLFIGVATKIGLIKDDL